MSKSSKSTQENRIAPWLENASRGVVDDLTRISQNGQSFIAPQSRDTLNYFDAARGFTGSGDAYRNMAGQGPYLLGAPQAYISQGFVPQQAQNAGNASDIGQAPQVTANQASKFVGDYMNPYLRDVVDTSLADYDVGADRTRAARLAAQDAGSAFGSRSAVANAVYDADAARGRGALSANLRSGAFDTALGAAQGDANRLLSGDTFNAGNALQAALANQSNQARNLDRATQNSQFNSGQYNNAAQFNLGAANRASEFNANAANNTALANQDARYRTDEQTLRALGMADMSDLSRIGLLGDIGARQDAYNNAVSQEPLELLRMRASLLGGLPASSSSTTTSNPGLMGTLGGLGSLAFGLGSLGWNPFGAAAGIAGAAGGR